MLHFRLELRKTGKEQDFIVHLQSWPVYDANLAKEQEISIPIQINGKVRGTIKVSEGILNDEASVLALLQGTEDIQNRLIGKTIKNQRYVPGKIISIVTD